jgi:hypothetical protein
MEIWTPLVEENPGLKAYEWTPICVAATTCGEWRLLLKGSTIQSRRCPVLGQVQLSKRTPKWTRGSRAHCLRYTGSSLRLLVTLVLQMLTYKPRTRVEHLRGIGNGERDAEVSASVGLIGRCGRKNRSMGERCPGQRKRDNEEGSEPVCPSWFVRPLRPSG